MIGTEAWWTHSALQGARTQSGSLGSWQVLLGLGERWNPGVFLLFLPEWKHPPGAGGTLPQVSRPSLATVHFATARQTLQDSAVASPPPQPWPFSQRRKLRLRKMAGLTLESHGVRHMGAPLPPAFLPSEMGRHLWVAQKRGKSDSP